VRPHLEVLEDRTLLATSRLLAGVLTVTRDDVNGQVVLSSGGAADRVLVDGAPISGVSSIVVNGGSADDTLVVDDSQGPVAAPIAYNGGAGFDVLVLRGGTATADTYAPGPTPDAGVCTLAFGGVTQTVRFTGLEPVVDSVPAPNLTVTGTSGSLDTFSYTQGSSPATGLVAVGNMETIEFSNKTTLTLDGMADQDKFFINNPNTPTGLTGITVHGHGNAFVTFDGTGAADTITVDAAGTIRLNGQAPVRTTGVQELDLFGIAGHDTFNLAGNNTFPEGIVLDAGLDGGTLRINAPGSNQFVVVQRTSGESPGVSPFVRTFTPGAPTGFILYRGITTVTPNVAVGSDGLPNDLILDPDSNEPNDSPATATRLATFPAQVLHANVTDSPPDQDFYRIVPRTTGTVDVQVAFRLLPLVQGMGLLSAEVQDAAGNLVAKVPGTFSMTGAAGGLRFRLPVVAGQTYYLRVFNATHDAFNNYDLSVGNAGLPVPGSVALSPPAATARVNNPTLFVAVDNSGLLQDPGANPALGPIALPFNASTAPGGTDVTAGFRIAVFDSPGTHHPLDPNDPTFLGFAQPVAGTPHLYALQVGSQGADALAEGPHSITARVQVVDPAGRRDFGSPGPALSLTVATGTPNQCYVAQLYRDILGREIDPYGSTVWAGALDLGIVTRDQVALRITTSPEYQNRALDQLYSKLLRRAVDAGGRAVWDAFLAHGGSLAQVEANILASPEYFQSQGGNSNAAWLQAVYQDVLGRALDPPGQTTWGDALGSGAGLLAVAGGILGSPEVDLQTVAGFYRQFLRREPEADGLAGFTGALEAGAAEEAVLAALVGSPEYFQRFCQT
jgi:hypothetical protein